ncbi:MAG: dehydrogenase with different specificity (related to short-chain alcohol dehydrogenase)-like [Paucimonas sp.]|nr:dehydrogenase with different specificity (related to short-chain alcohol dehydrogenase)-like [Paucimonas sp.]
MKTRTQSVLHGALLALAALLFAGCASTRLSPAEEQAAAGKTYVVTGASSGIGRGVAQRLGAMRANVVLAARRTGLLEQVAGEVRRAGGMALVQTVDVSRPEDMRRLADAAVSRFGKIDVWINDAGVGAIGPFEQIPLVDHARLIDVNLKGVIYGSHFAIARFKQQGYGTLVNVGSVESEVPLAYQASYSASKAGVLSLGRALNEELRLAGMQAIKVSTVMPFATDTPFFDHVANYSGGQPQMLGLDPPEKAVDAVIAASLRPREEVPVGWKGSLSVFGHRWTPDISEYSSASAYHRLQMEKAGPAPATSGNLHQPMQQGQGVDGGWRERMRADRKAQEAK